MLNNANPAVIDALNHVLADSFVVYFKTHSYHWNVVGRDFKPLHDMFQEQYEELWTAIDDIAERIRILGAPAPCSMAALLQLTDLKEATDAPDAMTMVKDLAAAHTDLAKHIRQAIEVADDADDEGTEDMLIARLQVHEKTAWMLASTAA